MKIPKFYLALLFLLVACAKREVISPLPPENVDSYSGIYNEIYIGEQTSDFHCPEAVMQIQTSSGDIISRNVVHRRLNGESLFTLDDGLKTGDYRLLELIYKDKNSDDIDQPKVFGLGCSVNISKEGAKITSSYSPSMGLSGSGTAEDPYIISSPDNLEQLRSVTNSEKDNTRLLSNSTHFRQTNPIDMSSISYHCGDEGWLPIGNSNTTAFPSIYNGGGYKIRNLIINRPNLVGVGLFGNITGATIDSVVISRANITGGYGTAALVGAVVTAGNERQSSQILNSKIEKSTITGISGGLATAGLVGVVDQNVPLSLISCSTDSKTSITGSYGVGGLVGISSIFSLTLITDCHNESPITAEYSGAGGIVGSADTLYLTSCTNVADISGGEKYQAGDVQNAAIGAGGIAGGSGISFLTSCTNTGDVSGYEGVGGLLGSTRIKGNEHDAPIYNNTIMQGCSNTSSSVSGQRFVGGLCGEAQFGCFSVYNTASVKSFDSYAGGIVGATSISVVHNALNTGSVEAKSYCSGIVAKTTFGSIALNRNFGAVNGDGKYVAGIVGLSGNNTMIHYCTNYGHIKNKSEDITAGIVGKVGDPREWSGWDIAECVIGSLELLTATAGFPLACTKEALIIFDKFTGTAETIIEISEVGEKVVDVILMPVDKIALHHSRDEYKNPEMHEEFMLALEDKAKDEMSAISSEIKQIESNEVAKIQSSASFDDKFIGKSISENTKSIVELCEANEEVAEEFQIAINEKREERYEDIESSKRSEEVVHNAISGICIAVSIGALIASAFVSGGMSVVVASVGALSAIAGGGNAISKSVDNFTMNAVVISQCTNMGAIEVAGEGISISGGIVGHMQQSCQVKDCVNAGKMVNSNKAGAICGEADSNTDFTRCLSVGEGWTYPVDAHVTSTTHSRYHDCYCVYSQVSESLSTSISAESAGKANTYNNWSIGNEENSLWNIPNTLRPYPIPYKTEMLIKE